MKVLVCGSRSWSNVEAVQRRLDELPAFTEIIHGDARGADNIAASYAMLEGRHAVRAFRADWKKLGRRAGIVRNLEMLDQKPDLVLAFWDGESRGTKHTIDEARARGIPVEVIGA